MNHPAPRPAGRRPTGDPAPRSAGRGTTGDPGNRPAADPGIRTADDPGIRPAGDERAVDPAEGAADPVGDGPEEAARAYKAVVAGLTTAADALRESDAARAAGLAAGLADRDQALTDAGQRTALTDLVVSLHWEAALEALWDEQWMTLRPRPGPTPADPARLDELEAAVERSAEELQAAIRQRWYRRG